MQWPEFFSNFCFLLHVKCEKLWPVHFTLPILPLGFSDLIYYVHSTYFSNHVGIICPPPIGIGLTDLPKLGGRDSCPTAPSVLTSLLPRWLHNQQRWWDLSIVSNLINKGNDLKKLDSLNFETQLLQFTLLDQNFRL